MGLAVAGLLTPVAGAVAQEVIDLAAILNAARVALVRRPLADFAGYTAGEESSPDLPESVAARKAG
jgi:hypothetical protein